MITQGTGDNGLAVVLDARTPMDKENDLCFDYWPLGRRALGRAEWGRTLKIALRDHGTDPWTAKQTSEARDDVIRLLTRHRITAVVPVQTPAIGGVRQVHTAWNLVGHPGNPYKWAGTVESKGAFYVCPVLHPANYEAVYGWLIERWLQQAHAVAGGKLAPMPWPKAHIHADDDALYALGCIAAGAGPVAVDIETNMAGTIVTAIGLSDGVWTVSVPWHGYTIAGTEGEHEPALGDYARGQEIQTKVLSILGEARQKKILHNGTFDVLMLARFGITLAGFTWDTLLMHRVAYSQYRHGLQQSAATEFCIEPWKCLWKPSKVKGQDEWCANPRELRTYNAKDTLVTYRLAHSLAPKIGVKL